MSEVRKKQTQDLLWLKRTGKAASNSKVAAKRQAILKKWRNMYERSAGLKMTKIMAVDINEIIWDVVQQRPEPELERLYDCFTTEPCNQNELLEKSLASQTNPIDVLEKVIIDLNLLEAKVKAREVKQTVENKDQLIRRREVLSLRLQGLTCPEIATITKLSLSTIKFVLHKFSTIPELSLQNFQQKKTGRNQILSNNHISYIKAIIQHLDGVATVKMITMALRTEFFELKKVALSTVWRCITKDLGFSKTVATKRNFRVLNTEASKER